jgi:hypothetical protein
MSLTFGAALLLAQCPSWAADPAAMPDDHRAPVESLAQDPARDQRRAALNDMWQRGILGTDMNQWSPQDLELLRRMRQAEAAGALGLLRRHFLSWKGLVLRDRPAGSNSTRLRLTRLGFDKYLDLKSQEALRYFEHKEIETKWAYWLNDLEGNALFDRGTGLLTETGDELYSRTLANRPTFWRLRTGEVRGNRPVPPELRPKLPPPPAPRPAVPTSTNTAVFTAPAPAPGKAR